MRVETTAHIGCLGSAAPEQPLEVGQVVTKVANSDPAAESLKVVLHRLNCSVYRESLKWVRQ